MKLLLNDDTEFILPETLYLEDIKRDLNWVEERAPFTDAVVLAGDGLPVSEILTIKGTAYFEDTQDAIDWMFSLRTALRKTIGLEGDMVVNHEVTSKKQLFDIHTGDVVFQPLILPRQKNVTIKLYPKNIKQVYNWGI